MKPLTDAKQDPSPGDGARQPSAQVIEGLCRAGPQPQNIAPTRTGVMRALTLVALLASSLLAGCSDGGDPDAASDTELTFDDLDLEATSSTGIIRGVVVDDAIRPIAGARVVLSGGDSPGETESTESGAFGFSGLEPGTYFLSVSKAGHFAAQQSADVVAGVAEPPIVKVLLQIDVANLPYYEAYVFDGYIECSGSFVAVSFAACSAVNLVGEIAGVGNVTTDNFGVNYQLNKKPTWMQAEMVWESTQALGDEMALLFSWDCGDDNGGFLCDHGASGLSPVLLTANATEIEEINEGDYNETIFVRVFNEGLSETQQDPIPGGGVGLTLQQRFTVFTHVFYGYEPTPDWRFSSDEPVPTSP